MRIFFILIVGLWSIVPGHSQNKKLAIGRTVPMVLPQFGNDTLRGYFETYGKLSSRQIGLIPNDSSSVAKQNNSQKVQAYIDNADLTGLNEIEFLRYDYYFDTTITMTNRVALTGDGFGRSFRHPRLLFQKGLRGIYNYANSYADQPLRLEGIRLQAYGSLRGDLPYGPETGHGVGQANFIHLYYVIIDGFTGEGLNLSANSSGGSNANLFYVFGCTFMNNGSHGLRIGKEDANAGRVEYCAFINNGGDGLRDDSFLGNDYAYIEAYDNDGDQISVTNVNANCTITFPVLRDSSETCNYAGQVVIVGGFHAPDTGGANWINEN